MILIHWTFGHALCHPYPQENVFTQFSPKKILYMEDTKSLGTEDKLHAGMKLRDNLQAVKGNLENLQKGNSGCYLSNVPLILFMI